MGETPKSTGPDWAKWMMVGVAGLAAALIGLTLSVWVFGPPGGQPRAQSGVLAGQGSALIGGPFDLVDQAGRPVDQSLLEGQISLVYFGFTYCPDFCPTELANMAAAAAIMRKAGAPVRLVFVTIDPERDDPETMKAYVEAFDPEMIGLTGTVEQVRKAAQAYRVFYRKVEREDAADGYTMDHSTFVYAMDAKGQFITHFRYGTSPQDIAARLGAGES